MDVVQVMVLMAEMIGPYKTCEQFASPKTLPYVPGTEVNTRSSHLGCLGMPSHC